MQLAAEYPTLNDARAHLKRQSQVASLCQKLCHLEVGDEDAPCFQQKIRLCLGACCGSEAADAYNERAERALVKINSSFGKESFFLLEKGRHADEQTVVWVEKGRYQGFGYVDTQETLSLEDLQSCIQSFPNNPDIQRLIRRYCAQHEGRVKKIAIPTE